MTDTQKQLVAQILSYIFETEERHFEECGCPDEHIYNLARTAWVECELDIQGEGKCVTRQTTATT
jgi:hypothetical protein